MRGPEEKGCTARQGQYKYDDKYLIFLVKDFFVKLEPVFQIRWFGKRTHHIPQTCI